MKIKKIIIFMGVMFSILLPSYAQQKISGVITNANSGQPIEAATVTLQSNGQSGTTDKGGRFELQSTVDRDSITIRHINYEGVSILWKKDQITPINILLSPAKNVIETVEIQSGYNELSKEKAVGSYSTIGREILERTVSANILERLDGVASGLSFNRISSTYGESQSPPEIRIRGVNTIFSSASPLIVVDNFPYEGNIEDINPNDVESVTLLKDASATSIWGTRAGNGVIVITTKKGQGRQSVTFTSNMLMKGKPDLSEDRTFLDASTIMEIEKMRFDENGYVEHNLVQLPDYVELLYGHRHGAIDDGQLQYATEQLIRNDVRTDAEKYLYTSASEQQYFLNIAGTNGSHNYYISGGYNRNLSSTIGNKSNRATLDFKNTLKLFNRLNISTGLNYTHSKAHNNGITLSSLNHSQFRVSPYTRLVDEQGNALDVSKDYKTTYVESAPNNGLVDWTYRPVDEIELNDQMNNDRRLRLNVGLDIQVIKDIKLSLLYQYQYGATKNEQYYDKESYYVRNLVNRFTQADGTQIIPYEGILKGGLMESRYQYGRAQVDYKKDWMDHNFTAFMGTEIRQELLHADPDYLLYNYDNTRTVGQTMFDYTKYYTIRPEGSALIPGASNLTTHLLDRFLSFYGNFGYSFKQRYMANISARWDGANIFGIRTNQKGTPLWSTGFAWNINKETFFENENIAMFKLRATYGYSGNVNKNINTVPTIYYTNDNNTGLQRAILQSTGNPDLRWEKVSTINIGTDISLKNERISASLDYYVKHADDLIGYAVLDPTTGIFQTSSGFEIDNRTNYANMVTKGLDMEISTVLTRPNSTIKIGSSLILNHTTNRITKYMDLNAPFSDTYFSSHVSAPPQEGKSRDVIYALPWHGLDGKGNPIIYIDGETTEDYAKYYSQLELKNVIDAGVTVPRYTASLRNDVAYKNFTLSFLLSYKGGHKFRRSSINYVNLYNGGIGHRDYHERWQQEGDEATTDVPSMPTITALSPQREKAYLYSEALIERGDHIRIQDINLSYQLPQLAKSYMNLKLYFLVSNVGIIWRSNNYGIDPDYPVSTYPLNTTFTIGAKLNL